MLPSTAIAASPQQAIPRLVAAVVFLYIATVAVGKFSLWGPVKAVDEPLFETLVDALQAVPGLTWFSQWATQLSAISVTYVMISGAAAVYALWRRKVAVPALMILTLFGAHVFQRLVGALVNGTIPVDPDIIGSAGPFFSGGVQRVIVVFGVLASVAQPMTRWSDRTVFRIALAAGVFVAITRAALGRHWPFDLVAAFPIGFTILFVFRGALAVLDYERAYSPLALNNFDDATQLGS